MITIIVIKLKTTIKSFSNNTLIYPFCYVYRLSYLIQELLKPVRPMGLQYLNCIDQHSLT